MLLDIGANQKENYVIKKKGVILTRPYVNLAPKGLLIYCASKKKVLDNSFYIPWVLQHTL